MTPSDHTMIDFFSHVFRWWASMGALLGLWPVTKWLHSFNYTSTPLFPNRSRFLLAVAMALALFAILIAGAIIPWASDGRIEGFTEASLSFRTGMAVAWLFWGLCAWVTAFCFSHARWKMAAASVLWFGAVAFALLETSGAGL